jgi:hypothetical protein
LPSYDLTSESHMKFIVEKNLEKKIKPLPMKKNLKFEASKISERVPKKSKLSKNNGTESVLKKIVQKVEPRRKNVIKSLIAFAKHHYVNHVSF